MPAGPDEAQSGNTKNPEMAETRTSIDRLLELLKLKGKTELNSIAVTLSIDPRIVENWAKVLENGNLIKIDYEVGRMYLEPVNLAPEQQQALKSKQEFTKFMLEEDMAIERISLDKFSKNIEELNNSITSISKVYQAKLPDVKKALDEVDSAYAPLAAKKKMMASIVDVAQRDFDEVNRKADGIYAKLDGFLPKRQEANINERLTQLNGVLQSLNEAETAMKETELNSAKFFKSMETEIDSKMKAFKLQISDSKSSTEQAMKTNSRQILELTKGIVAQVKSAQTLLGEVENFRKEFELAKRDLDVLKGDFADRYSKIKQGMENDIKFINEGSKHADDAIKSIKDSFGDLSKYDDEIKRWRAEMNDMQREVTTTRTDIIKLTTQLNALETDKSVSVEQKAKTMAQLEREGMAAKAKTEKIKKVIKETADEINERVEGAGKE